MGQHPHTIFDLRSSIHLLRKIYEKSTKNFSYTLPHRAVDRRLWDNTPTQSSIFDLRSTCYEKFTKNQRKIFRRPSPTWRWIEDCGATPPHNLRASIFDPPATKILRNIFRRSAESPCTKCKSYEYKLLTNCKFRFVTARVFGLKKRKVYWL